MNNKRIPKKSNITRHKHLVASTHVSGFARVVPDTSAVRVNTLFKEQEQRKIGF